MPQDYLDVYIRKKIEPLLEKLLNDKEIQKGLVEFKLRATPSGVVQYAVFRLLKDKGMFREESKPTRSKGAK